MQQGKQLHEKCGRKAMFDSTTTEDWVKFIAGDDGSGYAIDAVEADDKATELARLKMTERGIDVPQEFRVHRSTLRKLYLAAGARKVKPDHNTNPRAEADANVNNAETFCTAMKAVMPLIDPRMVGNPDALHYTYKKRRGKVEEE